MHLNKYVFGGGNGRKFFSLKKWGGVLYKTYAKEKA